MRVVLAGNPNSGKSSLFNQLTGLNQKISNVTGTTVENKSGSFIHNGVQIMLIDTPGTYSIEGRSIDEKKALEALLEEEHNQTDLLLYVADASNLKRNLLYFSQLSERSLPCVLVLTMLDLAQKQGVSIDRERLELELGIPVVLTNPLKGEGLEGIKSHLLNSKYISHYKFVKDKNGSIEERYSSIDLLVSKSIQRSDKKELRSEHIDSFALHPVWGYLMFLVVLFVVFQSVFKLAEWPMAWIENGLSSFGVLLSNWITTPWLESLLVDGVLAGLSGVLIFVPQIAILFFFLALMEDTGYMARISFLMDRLLQGFGLNGKSVIPLISGAACAIPAIMAARNIEDKRSRIITIMVTPLMSCSARLPVYTLLIALVVPEEQFIGIFSLKGLILMGMYILGVVASLLAALVFKIFLKLRSSPNLVFELPYYRAPRWQNIGITCWQKSRSFITQAGKIIFLVSVLLWFLSSYQFDQNAVISPSAQIEESIAGDLGKSIEPIIKPLGYNWKIGIALLTSFAAREVFVGTIATLYSLDEADPSSGLTEMLRADTNPDGTPVFSLGVIVSLLLFYAFAMQCFSTLAVTYKETGSIKWPIIQFVFMTSLAYLASFIAFSLF